ncbi:F1F0 ATP synthase subunit 4 [Pichia kluyveri]|uniref:ATP synthase subunit 4 n=1 Tax=Pichia kluyveri TaxID=36015 RepID=A0AAV5R7S6_PICKL|nr:F1F0 ATP synthase subunit 4 [Pichia kluyveri]
MLSRSITSIPKYSTAIRCISTTPKDKANSIIDSLPGNSIISKTGILATSAAASIYAISSELYVVNDETILLATFIGFMGLIGKVVAPMYGEFARDRTAHVSKILNDARLNHINAIKDRINQVSNLKDIVSTTKTLFEISKETAALEAESFELKQKVNVTNEAKSVLDSWIRYEAQVRQLEQQQLSSNVIAKIQNDLKDPKLQDKILAQAITDVEKLFSK